MEMEYDVKREARNQYLNYFKIWFIIVAVLIVISAIKLIGILTEKEEVVERTNTQAPQERVFDEANVLSDSEEEKLRKLIADAEAKIHCDLVVWTINQPVEGSEAESYNYRYDDWELNMRDLADDYYDYNYFGYDNVDYDGALLLDNWYSGQAGSWLSTSGEVYEQFGDYEINQVLDEVYYTIEGGGSAYSAYAAYVKEVVKLMEQNTGDYKPITMGSFVLGALIIPLIAAAIFLFSHLKTKEGKVTTNNNTYVSGNVQMNRQNDAFIRKTVSTRRIETSSSGGSRSGSSGGRGGSHRSSSGRSHGGGGRRR
ncbi:MAG: TPM domain-containing protein [Lachnospiraceae bacterium]|nr:TPM domain-containing protein [Lachnospiraceae bacterium]